MDSASTASMTSAPELSHEKGGANTSNEIESTNNPPTQLPIDFHDSSYPGFDEESTVCCTPRSVETNLENEIHKNLAESSDDESDDMVQYQTLASLTLSSQVPLSEFIEGQRPKLTLNNAVEPNSKNFTKARLPPPLSEARQGLNASSKQSDQTSSKVEQKQRGQERKHEWGNFANQGPIPVFECSPFVPKDKKKKYEYQRTAVPPPDTKSDFS